MRRWNPLAAALVAAALASCSDSTQPKRGAVRGTVKLDGQPLPTGKVRFFPLTSGIGTEGTIENGQFTIPPERGPTPGKYRVEFVNFQKTGRKVRDPDGAPGDLKDEIVDTLPPHLNRMSTYQVEYELNPDKTYDFDLKSK